jgi:hypothetical protein
MTIVPLTLPSGSNPARFKQGGSQELINCYREDIGPEAKTSSAVYGSDGLQGFCTLQSANGPVRAILNVDGLLYVIAGTQLHTVTATGQDTLLGSMNISTTAPVYMQRNRRATPDILIVCDGLAYYCRAGVLAQVTDTDMLAPISMTFNDGYFIIGTVANQFQSGDLDNAPSWNALAFSRADANPDAIVTLSTLQQDILVFGKDTTEIHRDMGDYPFPYERVTVIQWGCFAAGSVSQVNGTVAFVAHDKTVRLFQGYDAVRISTPAQERDIDKLADPSTLTATSWTRNGHTFYKLSCTEFTWVCDTSLSPPQWHRRKTYGLDYWNVSFAEDFDGKIIVGDAKNGKLYEMNPEFYDDAGLPIVSRIQFAPTHVFPYSMTIDEIFFDVQKGVGTGQGNPEDVDPYCMIELSRDGGETFSIQRQPRLGRQGENLTRVREQQFGQFGQDGCVIAFSWSGKFARAMYAAAADVAKDAA